MSFTNDQSRAERQEDGSAYVISWSLGQGRVISDSDFAAFVVGDIEEWSFSKRLRIKFLLLRRPWRKEVNRWKETHRETKAWIQGIEFVEKKPPVVSKLRWVGVMAIPFAFLAFLCLERVASPPRTRWSIPDISRQDLATVQGLNAPKSPLLGLEIVEPQRGFVLNLRPTIRWKVIETDTKIQRVAIFGGDTKNDPIGFTQNPLGDTWQVTPTLSRDRDAASLYTVEIDYEVGTDRRQAYLTFAIHSQAAIDYQSGRLTNITAIQEAVLLWELGRSGEALRRIDLALNAPNVQLEEKGELEILQRRVKLTEANGKQEKSP